MSAPENTISPNANLEFHCNYLWMKSIMQTESRECLIRLFLCLLVNSLASKFVYLPMIFRNKRNIRNRNGKETLSQL